MVNPSMPQPRVEALIALLEKGRRKTLETLSLLTSEQWQRMVYSEPHHWRVRDLLAHFVSAEERLLDLVKDVASGGAGAPEGFDFDAFNAEEQMRLSGYAPQDLLVALDNARQRTLDWIRTLHEGQLDNIGQHPALGKVTLETMITAMYGHQLLHMRDLKSHKL